MVTLKEIAKECNVSATTVSNILNGKPKVSEETRLKVLDVVKKRGYQPNYIAQGLRRKKTNMIGIIADDIAQFTTPGMIESIMAFFEEKGYRTVVQNLRLYARWSELWYNNESSYRSVLEPSLQELRSIKVDGIIYVAGHARNIHFNEKDFSCPAVLAYAFSRNPEIPDVALDDEKGGYDVMKYLLSKGHRNIGVIAGREDNIHTQRRLRGLQKALYEADVPFDPENVCFGNWERPSGYKLAEYLVQKKVTAIFCMSDKMAGGVYDYLAEHEIRIGEEVSVVGYDNSEIAQYFYPPLTTMELPLTEVGQKAAEILWSMLEKEGDEETEEKTVPHIRIPCSIVERGSVKPAVN